MRAWIGSAVIAVGMLSSWGWPARADIFMYRDHRGVMNFTNMPVGPHYRLFLREPTPRRTPAVRRSKANARAREYDAVITDTAARHQIDVSLVKAVIHAESAFVADAQSPKGAQGLMQLMPATAEQHRIERVFDPKDNIEGGVRHLRYLLDRYGGDLRLALAAYNAGEAAVERSGGVPPYPETVNYIARVLKFRDDYERQR